MTPRSYLTRARERWWLKPPLAPVFGIASLVLRVAIVSLVVLPLTVLLVALVARLAFHLIDNLGAGFGSWLINLDTFVLAPFMLAGGILLGLSLVAQIAAHLLGWDLKLNRLAGLCSKASESSSMTMLDGPFALYLREFRRDGELLRSGEEAFAGEEAAEGLFARLLQTVTSPLGRLTQSLRRSRYWSVEEVVADALPHRLPLVAIGRPGEPIPAAGAHRFYVANEAWQDAVSELARMAEIVFLRLGRTTGLHWELQEVLQRAPRQMTLLLAIDDAGRPMPARIVKQIVGDYLPAPFHAEIDRYLDIRQIAILRNRSVIVSGTLLSAAGDFRQPFLGWFSLLSADVAEALAEAGVSGDRNVFAVGMRGVLQSWWTSAALAAASGYALWPHYRAASRLLLGWL